METAISPLPPPSSFGTLKENSLHAALKQWYSLPGDQLETWVDNYIIDIVRDDLLIEIQTGQFSALKPKTKKLANNYKIQIIHPIIKNKWIIKSDNKGATIGKRKSPKKGRIEDLFTQLIRAPHIFSHPNISLTVPLVEAEELWKDDGKGSWRRKHWSISDKKLVKIIEEYSFTNPAELLALLPANLPTDFTNKDLASALKLTTTQAQKMTYSLRKMDLLSLTGKNGNSHLHAVNKPGI